MGDQDTASGPMPWGHLYLELGPVLYNYGCKMTFQTSLVEDSIHDVFVNVLKNHQHNLTIDNPKAYLFRAFRRELIHKIKAEAKSHSLLPEGHQFNIEVSAEIHQILEESSVEQQRKLSKAIQQLSPRQREAIYLKFYENHSYEEVASIMKVDRSALYTLIYKSLAQLRNILTLSFPSKLMKV